MELVVQARRGITLSVSTAPQPFLRTATEEAAAVEIYVGYDGEDPAQAQLLGSVAPGGTLVREYNPDRDANLRLYQRRLTVTGVPDVGQLLDAESVALPIDRTEAPALTQLTNALHTTATLGMTVNRFAKRMKVETSEVADFSIGVVATEEDIEPGLIEIPITRTSSGSGALTVYTRVSVSNGGAYGTPTVLSFTFANLAGSGGSSGGGTYPPGTIVPINHDEL